MKRKIAVAILVVVLLSLLVVGGVMATDGLRVSRQVFGSGGERVMGTNLILVGTLGEPISTRWTASGTHGLSSGFWWSPWYESYLPLTLKQ